MALRLRMSPRSVDEEVEAQARAGRYGGELRVAPDGGCGPGAQVAVDDGGELGSGDRAHHVGDAAADVEGETPLGAELQTELGGAERVGGLGEHRVDVGIADRHELGEVAAQVLPHVEVQGW